MGLEQAAEKVRSERERYEEQQRQKEAARSRGAYGAKLASVGVNSTELVSQINANLAQERDSAMVEVQRLQGELAALQNGAMMAMYHVVR